MPVGEHHDGIKLYESRLNRWNMMTLNGRDYMKELHTACDKADMKFLISNYLFKGFLLYGKAGQNIYLSHGQQASQKH